MFPVTLPAFENVAETPEAKKPKAMAESVAPELFVTEPPAFVSIAAPPEPVALIKPLLTTVAGWFAMLTPAVVPMIEPVALFWTLPPPLIETPKEPALEIVPELTTDPGAPLMNAPKDAPVSVAP